MSKAVLGFFLPSQIDYVLHTSDLSVLTTIAYFGISANKKGGLHKTVRGGVNDFRWNAWLGSRMTQLINKAHSAGTKVVLTVTRFGWNSAGYNTTVKMLSSRKARIRLARETADAVADRGVDGVNVDFEPIPASQRSNFVDFVRRLRASLNAKRHGLELTVASTGYIANYDIAGLTAPGAADAMFIMAYHYSGSWSGRAGAVSPLHRRTYDVTDTVNEFLKYTTPDKIMLGLPYYGNVWSTYSGKLNSKTRSGSSAYGYPGSVVYANAKDLAAIHGRLWNDIEKVPWTRWQARMCSSCPLTWRQLYYEDAQSLRLKHELVLSKGLRGTGIWTLGFGGTGSELNDELRRTFGSH
jgi:spore germination protein YaaH